MLQHSGVKHTPRGPELARQSVQSGPLDDLVTCYQQQHGQLVLFLVCVSVCVIMAKCGPDDTHFSGNYHRRGLEYFERCLYVCLPVDRLFQRVSVTTVQDAFTELCRCVFEI